MNKYLVDAKHVVDGDTFFGDLHLTEFGMTLNHIKFRLLGIDTPERGQENYFEATEFLAQLIEDKEVVVEVHGIDAFGRYLVIVNTDKELSKSSVNQQLLDNELAVVWEKGKK
jgi:micrococcal nuclease